nr:MAG TPA: hypothetical protein [Caudoviricetes sp.]
MVAMSISFPSISAIKICCKSTTSLLDYAMLVVLVDLPHCSLL